LNKMMPSTTNKIKKMANHRKKPTRIIKCLILTVLMVFSVPCDGRQSQSSEPVLETSSHTTNHTNSLKPGLRLTAAEKAWLKAHPNIVLGYTDAFEPEVIVNPDGSHRGILLDLLDKLNKRLGTRIRLRILPIPELVEKTQKKEVDGILSLTPGYADKLGLWKTRGHVTNYPTVFARKGVSFEHPSNLAYKRVAIIDEVFFSEKIVAEYLDGTTILKVKDALEGLRHVQQGEADLFLGASLNAYLITKYQLFDLATQYVFYDSPITAVIATRSDWPELSAILDKGLSSFSKKEIEDITAKWIHLPPPKKGIELTHEELAWISKNPTVRVCATNHAPLLYYKDGKPMGISADFLNEVSKHTGIKFDIAKPLRNFSSSMKGLIEHKGPDVIAGLNPTPERDKVIIFTKTYWSSPKFIFTRDDAPFVSNMEDLPGKTVAVIGGYVTHKLIAKNYPNIKLLIYKNNKEALRAVSSKKAFAFIGSLQATSAMINEFGLANLKASAPSNLPDAVVAMGIRSDWPELRNIMDKVFDAMPGHEKAAIVNRWSTVKFEHGIRPDDVIKWVMGIVLAALFIILVFLGWNRTLNRRVRERTIAFENEMAERKRTEVKIRESRDYLENLTDSMADAVYSVKMPERKIEWINDSFKVLGYDPDECIGRTTEFLYPSKESFIAFAEKMARALEEGKEILHTEQILRKKSGDLFPAEITLSFFKKEGELISTTAILRDISERKQTEALLRDNEEKLRHLVEQSPLSIQIFSRDGRIIQINEAWKALWGISEEMLPEVLDKYNVLEDEEVRKTGTMPLIERAFMGESVILPMIEYDSSITLENFETDGAGGRKVYVQARFYPIKNRNGEVVNVVSIEENITERKLAEEEIQNYQKRLKALASQLTIAEEKERRAIAADLHDHVGHSLALARMQLSEVLESNSDLERTVLVKDISHIMLQALQDTRSLIFELSSPSMDEIGLRAAVSEWLEEQIEKRYGIKTKFFDNIDNSQKVVLDENIRAILFRNVRELLTNVVKHARANQVTVSMEHADEVLKIVVQDDGVGFDYTPESQTVTSEGGFGLFSIQERMADMGGNLEIGSQPGKGCMAILNMPLDSELA
jgi:PAS domain S-box-containing protein